ncbi:uncharacterized protein TNCV_2014621 [Trichonephila clavipes]|nr:uncharacterized protein TNCV_2014621 [Trichonephila clavipes]
MHDYNLMATFTLRRLLNNENNSWPQFALWQIDLLFIATLCIRESVAELLKMMLGIQVNTYLERLSSNGCEEISFQIDSSRSCRANKITKNACLCNGRLWKLDYSKNDIICGAYVLYTTTSSMVTSESTKPCIVVEERGTADSFTGTTASTPSRISVAVSPSQRVCFLSPTEVSYYKRIELGRLLTRHLSSHESWNLLFLHADASFVRFNFSVPHNARMALLARRNEPPSITAYDIMEVIADHHRLYRRTTAMVRLISKLLELSHKFLRPNLLGIRESSVIFEHVHFYV